MAEERSTSGLTLIAVAALASGVAILLLVMRSRTRPTTPGMVLGDEERAYLSQIVVTNARMSAAENFLGQTVIYLDAQVTNKGPKVIRHLELELNFVDTLDQVVLRETVRPIAPRSPPLKPGEIRSFQVAFEHMPAEWNQALPTITPKTVHF